MYVCNRGLDPCINCEVSPLAPGDGCLSQPLREKATNPNAGFLHTFFFTNHETSIRHLRDPVAALAIALDYS